MDQESEQNSAALRAQWLAELAEALDEAQRLAWALGGASGLSIERQKLHARIEAARIELDHLRRGRQTRLRGETDPYWTRLGLWNGPPDPSADEDPRA